MRIVKKTYIGILTIVLVIATVITTTYAWVGILNAASVDNFDLKLKIQDLDMEYYLSISATGQDDDFADEVNQISVKRQVLTNMGYNIEGNNDSLIEKKFADYTKLDPVTATNDINNGIWADKFYALDYNNKRRISDTVSNKFMKFDIYLSLEHRGDNDESLIGVNYPVDVILDNIEKTLYGTISTNTIINGITYPSNAISNIYNITPNFTGVDSGTIVNIDTASATRIAMAIYEPIIRTDEYSSTSKPKKYFIYEGGTHNPTYNETTDTYSFGGILPEEYNLALREHKINHNIRSTQFNPDDSLINRGDLELIPDNKRLIDSSFGFGIKDGSRMKMKITVYFWFEGWDADCFEIIEKQKVNINLSFAADNLII